MKELPKAISHQNVGNNNRRKKNRNKGKKNKGGITTGDISEKETVDNSINTEEYDKLKENLQELQEKYKDCENWSKSMRYRSRTKRC